jgi:outer membrane protein OmpA-like peptidoglycan-associated protein
MQKNPSIRIEVSGHTDNVGDKQKNLELSEARAKSVMQFLIENRIDATRLSFKGFGDTKPIDTNDTAQGKANNRRTEFKIL